MVLVIQLERCIVLNSDVRRHCGTHRGTFGLVGMVLYLKPHSQLRCWLIADLTQRSMPSLVIECVQEVPIIIS